MILGKIELNGFVQIRLIFKNKAWRQSLSNFVINNSL